MFGLHIKAESIPELLRLLHGGLDVALVSSCGTPAVKDPGCEFVRAVHAEGLPLQTLPGPCSVTAALSVSGAMPNQ
eukprot:1796015-Amphidinium_carterae.1